MNRDHVNNAISNIPRMFRVALQQWQASQPTLPLPEQLDVGRATMCGKAPGGLG